MCAGPKKDFYSKDANQESEDDSEEERDTMETKPDEEDSLEKYSPLDPTTLLPLLGHTPSGHPVYYSCEPQPVTFFCIHGAGLSAMSFAVLARETAQFACLASFDLPGHGKSPLHPRHAADAPDLSLETLVDACHEALLFVHSRAPDSTIVLVGHSLGGNLAAKLERRLEGEGGQLSEAVVGLVIIDVVEGSAKEALPFMRAFLARQPPDFTSPAAAVRYIYRAKVVKNLESARYSVGDQFVAEGDHHIWRIDLSQTERYWPEWFEGLNRDFLACMRPKILVLAHADRMDKELTIAQMQGRFKLVVLAAEVGHILHEDEPRGTARELYAFLRQFRVPLGAEQQMRLAAEGFAAFSNGL